MDFTGRKILLIEDEVFTRKVLARLMATLGFAEVEEAADAPSGLAAVRTGGPDVVLCDVEMSPMDGFAFIAAVREAGYETLPIVLMSARIDPDRVAKAREMGATVLEKPVRAELFRRALEV